jgi:hypothetical protein
VSTGRAGVTEKKDGNYWPINDRRDEETWCEPDKNHGISVWRVASTGRAGV